MTKVYYVIAVTFLALLIERYFVVINGQGLQQLSYANADLGEKLIRSTIATTPIPTTSATTTTAATTTEKSGFFSGIRNIFSKKTTTVAPGSTVSTTSTSPRPTTTTTTTTQKTNSIRNNVGNIDQNTTPKPHEQTRPASTINLIIQTTVRPLPSATTTTTQKPKTVQREEFPPLPPPRNRPSSSGVVTPSTTTTLRTNHPSSQNAWSIHPTPNPIPGKQPTNQPNSPTTANPPNDVSDSELETLFENLYKKETATLFPLITINYQGRTHSSALTDEAPQPLLTINDTAIDSYPSIAKMRVLYNNYELDSMVNEYVTPMERNEENDFVDTLLATPLMRQAMKFLQDKGKVTADPKTHRELLKTIWFRLYSRGQGKIGSSGFEHIFLTELKAGQISGLHNWLYMHEEEKAGHLDYKGYIKKLELGTKGSLIKYRFTFNGITKPVNSMFIGTSPELEIALYTVCFEMRPDLVCPVSLGGTKFNIRTYTFRYRGKNLIGSAFPEL